MIGKKEKCKSVDYKKPKRMVRFRFFKEALDVKTDRAQLIKVGLVANPIEVWVPKSQIVIKNYEEDDKYLVIEMPYWLYVKTALPDYTDPEFYEEVE